MFLGPEVRSAANLAQQWGSVKQKMVLHSRTRKLQERHAGIDQGLAQPRRLQEKHAEPGGSPLIERSELNLVEEPSKNLVIAEQVVSWVGTVMAWFLFLSPLQTFIRICRERTVSGFDSTPYLVAALNCALWVSYAVVTPNRLALGVNNLVGGLISATWTTIYTYFSGSAQRKSMFIRICSLLGAWIALTLVDILAVPNIIMKKVGGQSLKTMTLGIACVLLNTLMYGAPLNIVRTVLRTQSVEFMPLPLSVMTFLTSCMWFTYSLLVHDPWLFIPNVLGVVMGFMQLAIYGFVASSKKKPGLVASPQSSPAKSPKKRFPFR